MLFRAGYGGESFEDVQQRAIRFLDSLDLDTHDPEDTILLAAHGMINKVILCTLLRLPLLRLNAFSQGNTCVNVVERDESGETKLLLLNCVRQLERHPSF